MRIYYLQTENRIKTATHVTPLRSGTIAEHFAHVLAVIDAYAKGGKSAAELKEIFYNLMSANSFMEKLLRHSFLIELYDFSGDDVAQRIAECFELAESDLTNSTDTRVIEAIPECPIYKTPIVYGIRFNDDPYWYELEAAYTWLVKQNKHRSPMNRALWKTINEVKQFNFFNDVLTPVLAIAEDSKVNRWLKEILEQLAKSENSEDFNIDMSLFVFGLRIYPYVFEPLPVGSESNTTMRMQRPQNSRSTSYYQQFTQTMIVIDTASQLLETIELVRENNQDSNIGVGIVAVGMIYAAYHALTYFSANRRRSITPDEEKEEKSSDVTIHLTSSLSAMIGAVATGLGGLAASLISSAHEEQKPLPNNRFAFFANTAHRPSDEDSPSLINAENNINYVPLHQQRITNLDFDALIHSNLAASNQTNYNGNRLFTTLRENFRSLLGFQRAQNQNDRSGYRHLM